MTPKEQTPDVASPAARPASTGERGGALALLREILGHSTMAALRPCACAIIKEPPCAICRLDDLLGAGERSPRAGTADGGES